MNNNYIIITDSNSEIALSIAQKYNIEYVQMPYTIQDEEHFYDLGEFSDFKAFFDKVAAGAMPSTSTYPPQYYIDMLRKHLIDGKDILFISFSSQLSAAYSFLTSACEELKIEFPDRQIVAYDTLRISGALALLVNTAFEMKEEGSSMDEVIKWLDENQNKANAYFTVDDLGHLKRGGRISPTSAAFGSMLSIKPMLCLNKEGKIVPTEKLRGRKKALRRLAQVVIDRAIDTQNNDMYIVHADSLDDANHISELIEKSVKFRNIIIQYIGPVIGSHCGPGTIAVCFMGKDME